MLINLQGKYLNTYYVVAFAREERFGAERPYRILVWDVTFDIEQEDQSHLYSYTTEQERDADLARLIAAMGGTHES